MTPNSVLPTQDVGVSRRSSPKAPKPNVVYASSGGPFLPYSDFAFAVSCEEALRAAFCCTFPSNCNLQIRDSGIFVHTATECVGRESGSRFTHTECLLKQRLPAEADADAELTQRQTTSRESQCNCSAPHIYWTGECPGKLSRRLTRTFPFEFEYKSNQFKSRVCTSSHYRIHFTTVYQLTPSKLPSTIPDLNVHNPG